MKTILAATGLALVLLLPRGVIAKPGRSERDAARAQAAEEEAENEEAAKNAAQESKAECVTSKARGG